jgi:hypothetical protein
MIQMSIIFHSFIIGCAEAGTEVLSAIYTIFLRYMMDCEKQAQWLLYKSMNNLFRCP